MGFKWRVEYNEAESTYRAFIQLYQLRHKNVDVLSLETFKQMQWQVTCPCVPSSIRNPHFLWLLSIVKSLSVLTGAFK